MNRLIILIAGMVFALSPSVYGQQPFEKYGYTVKKVLTLSQGKYEEFHDQDTLVQIGSIIMNRLNGEILSFVEYDTMYSEATLEPEIISRWLSPDPHAENYFSISPYAYVANNPILYIDPDGRDITIYSVDPDVEDYTYVQGQEYKGGDAFISSTVTALNYLSEGSKTANSLIAGLVNDGNFFVTIEQTSESMTTDPAGNSGAVVTFDENSGLAVDVGVISPAVGLAHELGHAENINEDKRAAEQRGDTNDSQYTDAEERKVITEVEQPVVNELNENGNNEGRRDNHQGTKVPVECSTCTY